MPQKIDAALKFEGFYTQAISTDAAVVHYGELPLHKDANAKFAVAHLAARTQSESPEAPDEIFVAAVQGGRVFVIYAPVAVKIEPVAACTAVRRGYEKKSAAAYSIYEGSERKDEKAFDRFTGFREQGDIAFRRCFTEKAGKQPAFARATRQAQALLDALPR